MSPFGKRNIKGLCCGTDGETDFEWQKIKENIGNVTDSVQLKSQLIALAGWMKKTMSDNEPCVKNPSFRLRKKSIAGGTQKRPPEADTEIEAKSELAEFERKHQKARVRLLLRWIENPQMDHT